MNVAVNARQWNGNNKPNSAAPAIGGPGRLYGAKYQQNTLGYMLLIGDQLRKDAPVFIGFAPMDGVGDLLRLVQMGSPDALAILTFMPCTFGDVAVQRNALQQWQCRTDDKNWFIRSDIIIDYVQKLRDEIHRVQVAVLEEMEAKEREAIPAQISTQSKHPMPPVKSANQKSLATQKSKANKRKQKPRWL
jgi:hypothetical protein